MNACNIISSSILSRKEEYGAKRKSIMRTVQKKDSRVIFRIQNTSTGFLLGLGLSLFPNHTLVVKLASHFSYVSMCWNHKNTKINIIQDFEILIQENVYGFNNNPKLEYCSYTKHIISCVKVSKGCKFLLCVKMKAYFTFTVVVLVLPVLNSHTP